MYSDESVYGEWRHSVFFFLFSVFKNSQSWKSRKKNLFKKTTFKNLNAVLLVVKNVPDLFFLGHLGYWVNVNFLEDFFALTLYFEDMFLTCTDSEIVNFEFLWCWTYLFVWILAPCFNKIKFQIQISKIFLEKNYGFIWK